MECSGCDRIARIGGGKNPDFVVELAESYVTLADEQAYRGYCILLLKDHHEDLTALPLERQVRLFEDVSRVATAMQRVLEPERINYACLGNMLRHIHWHVIPRYADDPEAAHPIWVRPLAERRAALARDERQSLVSALAKAMA